VTAVIPPCEVEYGLLIGSGHFPLPTLTRPTFDFRLLEYPACLIPAEWPCGFNHRTRINEIRNVQVGRNRIYVRPLKYHHAIACQSFDFRLQDWFCCGCAVYQIPKKNLKTCLIRFAAE